MKKKPSPLVKYYENKGVLQTENVSLSINRMGADVARDLLEQIRQRN